MRRLLALLFAVAACTVPREQGRADETCSNCHGSEKTPAPPRDLRGNTALNFPGVGAHGRHLQGSALFKTVECRSCHPVPEALGPPPHNDGVTQVLLSGNDAGYDFATRTCTNSACHGPVSGVWTRQREPEKTCGTCHALPPPAPHPKHLQCAACHGALDGGTHVNGTVDFVSQGAGCRTCHGSDETGAPPRALDGGTERTQRGVGAHAAHLSGGNASRPVPCATCHEVPPAPASPRHPNGGLAEVALAGFDSTTLRCTTACHGQSSPVWTSTQPLSCASCHGAPPPAPHPQMNDCATCHPVPSADSRGQHVDGTLQAAVPQGCDGCHGSAANAAPPRAVDGGTSTGSPGVGAHQAHLAGRGLARPVPCDECHRVPSSVRSSGHLDGLAQVVFSGVARANNAQPTYASGSCANTGCHDVAHFIGVPDSGGGQHTTPVWTRVDGAQSTCASCHGMPPPPPHVARADCASCHPTSLPLRHVDGVVDFQP